MFSSRVRPLLIFALAALALNAVFFRGLEPGYFIFSGDQFLRFSGHEAWVNSFFLRKSVDLGVLNGWQFTTQFWDTLYFIAAHGAGLSLQSVEKILFFLILFLSMTLSHAGLKRIGRRYGASSPAILAVTFWYCFNPYILELWHGGVYNLGSGLTYSLAPLIFHLFDDAVFSGTDHAGIIPCAFALAAASFTFWLVAPLGFFLGLYFVLRLLAEPRRMPAAFKNGILLSLAYAPLVCFVLFGIMHEFFSNAGDNNASFSPTYGNMQGGILYQLMMLFSWGIYTVWNPRTLYPFGDYFFSKPYIAGLVLLYLTAVVGAVLHAAGRWLEKIRRLRVFADLGPGVAGETRALGILWALFAASVFLAKGAQPPWGGVFTWMYEHVPFFSVFRTPDIRFGFLIVLTLALLLLLVSRRYRPWVFATVVVTAAFLQARPFFTGAAVRGENRKGLYYDRVVHLPETYRGLATFINERTKGPGEYILPLPGVGYGHYTFAPGEYLVGQDMAAKMMKVPFVYLSSSGGMASKTEALLKEIVSTQAYERLEDFPIRHVLLRKDVNCPDCPSASEEKLSRVADLVHADDVFRLYEMRRFAPLRSENWSPTAYSIPLSRLDSVREAVLPQSFHDGWALFAEAPGSWWGSLCFLWKRPLFQDTHHPVKGYANGWNVSAAGIKEALPPSAYSVHPDGSVDVVLTAFYRPQAGYVISALISLVSLLFLMFVWVARGGVKA